MNGEGNEGRRVLLMSPLLLNCSLPLREQAHIRIFSNGRANNIGTFVPVLFNKKLLALRGPILE